MTRLLAHFRRFAHCLGGQFRGCCAVTIWNDYGICLTCTCGKVFYAKLR